MIEVYVAATGSEPEKTFGACFAPTLADAITTLAYTTDELLDGLSPDRLSWYGRTLLGRSIP